MTSPLVLTVRSGVTTETQAPATFDATIMRAGGRCRFSARWWLGECSGALWVRGLNCWFAERIRAHYMD